MNIFERIQRMDCSPSEQVLKEAILKDPYHIAFMQMEEIVEEYAVSRATIYRFLEKNGLKGFSELKVHLLSDAEKWKASNASFNFNYPVEQGVSVQKMAENLERDYTQTILSTRNRLDASVLRTAAEKMEKADSTEIYTSAGNICFADNFRFQMKEIGKDIHVPHELYEQMLCAAGSDASHFAIVISFGGRNWQMEKLCRILHENHTRILLICSEQAVRLFPYVDDRLYFASYEDHADKISSFSTRVSLLYILDMLYTCYFERHYTENTEKKKRYYARMSQPF